jgi:hypothetical protein
VLNLIQLCRGNHTIRILLHGSDEPRSFSNTPSATFTPLSSSERVDTLQKTRRRAIVKIISGYLKKNSCCILNYHTLFLSCRIRGGLLEEWGIPEHSLMNLVFFSIRDFISHRMYSCLWLCALIAGVLFSYREFGLGHKCRQSTQSERWFLGLMAVSDQATNEIDQEVGWAAVT